MLTNGVIQIWNDLVVLCECVSFVIIAHIIFRPLDRYGMNYGSSSEDLPGLCADATSSSPNTSSHQQQQPPFHIPHNGSSSSLSSKVMPPSSLSSILDSEVGAAYPLGAHHNHVDSAVPCSITSNGVKASSSAAVLPNVRYVRSILYSS